MAVTGLQDKVSAYGGFGFSHLWETRRWARMDVNVPAIQTKPTEVG